METELLVTVLKNSPLHTVKLRLCGILSVSIHKLSQCMLLVNWLQYNRVVLTYIYIYIYIYIFIYVFDIYDTV